MTGFEPHPGRRDLATGYAVDEALDPRPRAMSVPHTGTARSAWKLGSIAPATRMPSASSWTACAGMWPSSPSSGTITPARTHSGSRSWDTPGTTARRRVCPGADRRRQAESPPAHLRGAPLEALRGGASPPPAAAGPEDRLPALRTAGPSSPEMEWEVRGMRARKLTPPFGGRARNPLTPDKPRAFLSGRARRATGAPRA